MIFLVCAVFSSFIAPYDPYKLNLDEQLQPPSFIHLFGTDTLGRDVLSRIIYGTQYAFLEGVVIIGLSFAIGIMPGVIAGYSGGNIGDLLMRITDMFMAFPTFAFAIALVIVWGPSLWHTLVAMALVYWPRYARLTYGQTLSVREMPYVKFAKLIGESRFQVILRHIIPNVISPVIIYGTLDLGDAILLAAALSFLGLGAQPPAPEWGAMVNYGRDYIMNQWWLSAFPGFACLLLVLGFNLLGDGLRDALDPVLRRTIYVKSEKE